MNIKAGFVTIIGRPNVGKSTFLNNVLTQKIVITSPKPQTTRSTIKGILTLPEKNAQIIFIDTPGFHRPHNLLGKELIKNAKNSIKDADIVLFMVDITKEPNDEDIYIKDCLKHIKIPIFLLLNKIDLVSKNNDFEHSYINLLKFNEIFKISAITGTNIEQLIDKIIDYLPQNPYFYDEEQITDKTERAIIAELIREQIFYLTAEEIPYSTAVIIENMKDRREDLSYIAATIVVEKESQKAILIGEGGKKIKEIGTLARKSIEEFLGRKVYLDLHIKVVKNWRKNQNKIKEFLEEI